MVGAIASSSLQCTAASLQKVYSERAWTRLMRGLQRVWLTATSKCDVREGGGQRGEDGYGGRGKREDWPL